MNKDVLLAFLVWAIDRDLLTPKPNKAWELFRKDAKAMIETYTNPDDPLLYCGGLLDEVKSTSTEDVFADYILFYAKLNVVSGGRNYGVFDESIINYKSKQNETQEKRNEACEC